MKSVPTKSPETDPSNDLPTDPRTDSPPGSPTTAQANTITNLRTSHTEDITWKAELARKSIHLLVVALPLGMIVAGIRVSLFGLGILAGAAVAADVIRARNAGFEELITRFFGMMMRPRELSDGSGRIRLNGSTLLLVGAFVSLGLFGVINAAYGLIIFLVADAAAGLAGRRFGGRRLVGGKATISGSSAFILAGVLVTLALPDLELDERFLVVAGSALAEAVSPIDDNLIVPIVASALLYFL